MLHDINRRQALRLGLGAIGALALNPLRLAQAAEGRVLKINSLASAAAVNVPLQAALRSILPTLPGYGQPAMQPTAKINQIVQEVVTGGADLGDADIASTLTAAEAGADVRIIGLSYSNTSQVIVANLDRIKTLADLGGEGVSVAVNSIGDFMYVMLQGVLAKHGIDAGKINFIEMGSSGDRMRALLAGRVDAVPMHVEQAEQLKTVKGRGTFGILVRPWQEYDNWFSAVIVTTASWLKSKENQDAAVAVLKSILTAFRRTNSDYAWYKSQVGQWASSKDLKAAGDDFLKPVWQTLTTGINAFPADMGSLTVEQVAKVIPVYQRAGALKGTVDLQTLIDRTWLDRALKELGAA
ncbi:NMT1/THI5 domain protein, transporter [Sodalis praecaptivus]|uniref:NMT1/THI5 domain protein, transporter n=1 Tax=Sodalis praecaptivus TaxID=1239307 RepID=W0HVP8_9GAMM|nr:ABC transporter substrate-binding protein [Sodalis praecaptivus]AHF76587.1 NMT1/THI5 domain protein, transporter [Sodalis praecaptivus]